MGRTWVFLLFLLVILMPEASAEKESLGYLYNGDTAIYTSLVDRTGGSLTVIAPDYFELDGTGKAIQTRKPDAAFVMQMQKQGLKVIPFLSNHWDQEKGRAGLRNGDAVVAQLVSWVKEYGFDGIDIDIENLTHEDRENFTSFLRKLRERLPKGKMLTVCVAANPWNLTTGWQGQYDYAALGQICDWVFLMTYDESYSGGPPGPVSSRSFLSKSIEAGLKKIPREKLMAGVPFYGRYWKAATQGQPAVLGGAFTVSDIERLIVQFQAPTWYDAAKECARTQVTIPAGVQVSGLWGGKKLTPGVYDIWYENAQSYEKKLELIGKSGIRGVGAWALGQEPAHLWSRYGVWLNGYPFQDISYHWAKEHILALYEIGMVKGRTPDHFVPNGTLTRLEAAILIARLLELPGEPLFECIDRGILQGYPDGELRINNPVTRGEFTVMLNRVVHTSSSIDYNEIRFADVSPVKYPWANEAIVNLTVHGALHGLPDGQFHPSRTVTRGEATKILDLVRGLPLKVPEPTPKGRRRLIEGSPVIEPR